MEAMLREKLQFIDSIVARMKGAEPFCVADLLRKEIKKLQKINREYEDILRLKSVASKEEAEGKTKYRLCDGSLM